MYPFGLLNVVNNSESALSVTVCNVAGVTVTSFLVEVGETSVKEFNGLNES